MFPRKPNLGLVETDVWVFDLYDGAVDDMPHPPLVDALLPAVDDEELLQAAVGQERDPPRKAVDLAGRPDPRGDEEGRDARPERQVDVQEEELLAV